MPNVTKLEDVSLTKRDFCKLFGDVSMRTVEKWVEAGMPRQAVGKGRVRFGADAVVWAWTEKTRQNGKAKKNGAHEEKTRLEVEKLKMEVDREKGLLTPVSTFDEVVADLCVRVDSKLQALPQKWAPELLDISDMGTMTDRLGGLKEEIRAEIRATGEE